MSTHRLYYTAKDIAQILGISRTKSYEILHIFAARGQLFKHNGIVRVQAVHFEKWIAEIEAQSCNGVINR